MPFVLLVVGELLLVTGIQGTNQQLFDLLSNDFTGKNSFIYWLFAIAVIGGLGYVPGMKPISNAFLLLVLLVLFLKTSGSSGSNLTQSISTSLQQSTQGNLIPISDATVSNSTGGGTSSTQNAGSSFLSDFASSAAAAVIAA